VKKDRRGYLEDILVHTRRILDATDAGFDVFADSWLIQDAVIRNFEVLGEIVKRLDQPFMDRHPEVPWRKMTAFRNVLIHEYEDLQVEIVWRTISDDLPALRAAVEALLAALPAGEDEH